MGSGCRAAACRLFDNSNSWITGGESGRPGCAWRAGLVPPEELDALPDRPRYVGEMVAWNFDRLGIDPVLLR